MSIHKFKALDLIANRILDQVLKLDLTLLETQYVINEICKFSFSITKNKIPKIKDSRVVELEQILKKLEEMK